MKKLTKDKSLKLIFSIQKSYRSYTLAMSHGLKLQIVHWVIEFNQKAWLKPYITLNKELRTKVKRDSEKDFFKVMKNLVFRKTMENVRKH